MAMETVPPSQTLHLPRLRRRWQILFLQVIATVALLALLFRMTEVYGPCDDGFLEDGNNWCPSYEHTRGLMWVNEQPSFQDNALSGSDGLILPRELVGIDSTGFASQVAPLTVCFLLAGLWMFYQTRGEKVKLWTRRGCTAVSYTHLTLPTKRIV